VTPYRQPPQERTPSLVVRCVPFLWYSALAYAVMGYLFLRYSILDAHSTKVVQNALGAIFYLVVFGFWVFPVIRFKARLEGREVVVEGSRWPHLYKTITSTPIDEVDRFDVVRMDKYHWLALVTTKPEAFPLQESSWKVGKGRFTRAAARLNRWLEAVRADTL
jgi:hypothetical protein